MPGLIEHGDVINRLSGTPGFKLPTTITPDRIQDYIDGASGILLAKAGYTTPPKSDTNARNVLDDLCVRLVVLTILGDIYGTDPNMREANRRERNDLLAEAESLGEAGSDAASSAPFFDVVGAGSG